MSFTWHLCFPLQISEFKKSLNTVNSACDEVVTTENKILLQFWSVTLTFRASSLLK